MLQCLLRESSRSREYDSLGGPSDLYHRKNSHTLPVASSTMRMYIHSFNKVLSDLGNFYVIFPCIICSHSATFVLFFLPCYFFHVYVCIITTLSSPHDNESLHPDIRFLYFVLDGHVTLKFTAALTRKNGPSLIDNMAHSLCMD